VSGENDDAYLEQVRALSFEGRSWTPAAIEEVRDFLSRWSHNIRLAPGIYTAFAEDWYPEHRAIMNVIDRHLSGRYSGQRVLDLGCLEGYFSLECALHGADVIGVDAKEINIKKCEFVKSVLDVPNLSFVLDDAMNVEREGYGSFDVVLALGLLYHLDDPFTFLAQLAGVCDGFMVLDTLVALEYEPETIGGWKPKGPKPRWKPELSALRDFHLGEKTYRGRLYREYQEGTDETEKALSTESSYKNDLAVWLTEDALVSLLREVGFEQLEKIVFPNQGYWWSDPGRVLYVAHRRSQFHSKIFNAK
jgi:2-polyprenyl-3-methyl-5-hydroxy-6-metoxy-1,4-benzoquinol methylase